MPKKPTRNDRYRTRRILFDGKHDGSERIYDSDFHPDDMVLFFRERFDELEDPERYATDHRLDHVMRPVRLPTLYSYAATVGVATSTLTSWAHKYEKFDEAMGICQTIQKAMVIELTSMGAYNSPFSNLIMKNEHGWQDKVEQTHKGGVTLNFDAQDEQA